MKSYRGKIDTYDIHVQTPNGLTNYKRVMHLTGLFGVAFVYFVPEGGVLGTNKKRPGKNIFDVYYWKKDWEAFVDTLRNESPVYFYYNDINKTAQIYTGKEPVGEGEKILEEIANAL